MAPHLEVAVATLIPLFGKGIFLQNPAQVLSAADLTIAVDMLHGIDRMAAIGGFLGAYLQTPELRKVGEIIPVGISLRGRGANQAHAVIGQFPDSRLRGGKQGEFYSVNTLIIQDGPEPPLQQFIPGGLTLTPVGLPPLDKQGINLLHRGRRSDQFPIKVVDCGHIAARQHRCLLHGYQLGQDRILLNASFI